MKQKLPHAKKVSLFGVLSIFGSVIYGVFGIVCAVYALKMYNQDKQLFLKNPTLYSPTHPKWKFIAIAGLIMSLLFLMFCIAIYVKFDSETLSTLEALQWRIEHFILKPTK